MKMKNIRILCVVLFMVICVGCGDQRLEVQTELDEEEAILDVYDAEEIFKEMLAKETQETLVEMVVADFDNNGQVEAFAITADADMYARLLEEPEMAEGCMSSSFWYLSGDTCNNIYFEDKDAFLTLAHGMLADGTEYVMVEDWGSAHWSSDSLYTVEKNNYKLLFTLPSIIINDDGTISSYYDTYTNQGYVECVTVYEYINGELVTIAE